MLNGMPTGRPVEAGLEVAKTMSVAWNSPLTRAKATMPATERHQR